MEFSELADLINDTIKLINRHIDVEARDYYTKTIFGSEFAGQTPEEKYRALFLKGSEEGDILSRLKAWQNWFDENL